MHLFSVPPHDCQVNVYEEANVIARRISIPLFGAGLVEAIPDETLLALEDPDDRNGDGIRGRAARRGRIRQRARGVSDGSDGKRSRRHCSPSRPTPTSTKWGSATTFFPRSLWATSAREKSTQCLASETPEDVRNQRTGLRGIDNFDNFSASWRRPRAAPVDDAVLRGERLFQTPAARPATCLSCAPGRTQSAVPPGSVPLFSDLLLHDIGTGDGIEQADARAGRDPHARTVGTALPAAAAARRERRDD